MDIFQYNRPKEINGYSINDQYWIPAESTTTCNARCTATNVDNGNSDAADCYINEVYYNNQLRNTLYQSTSSNTRLMDNKNLYVIQVIHSFNMLIACAGLLYLIKGTYVSFRDPL